MTYEETINEITEQKQYVSKHKYAENNSTGSVTCENQVDIYIAHVLNQLNGTLITISKTLKSIEEKL